MRRSSLTLSLVLLLPVALYAQLSMSREHDILLKPWAAPLSWQPNQPDGRNAAARHDSTLSPLDQPAAPTSLVFVAMTLCRLFDTRSGSGFTGSFGQPSLVAGAIRTFPIQTSTTCTIPTIAQAYSFNVTVVPPGPLTYITVFPTGQALPNASTLNDFLGTVVANAAIVPAGNNGSVDVYASDRTDIIIDINGFYAPQGAVLNPAGNANTALGTSALVANTTGTGNTASGASSLSSNTTGYSNTANGQGALYNNTAGYDNTANGQGALYNNTTGSYNDANGAGALSNNTTGYNNTGMGRVRSSATPPGTITPVAERMRFASTPADTTTSPLASTRGTIQQVASTS